VPITQREQTKRPLFSRASAKQNTAIEHRRLLGDRADFVAGSIFLFENRGPDGEVVDSRSPQLSATEQTGRFARKFSRRLRGLFHDLRAQDLVVDDELPLFYWPQTSEARIRLAIRLRYVALTIRHEG
jgi:hypothetical protein